MNKTLASLVIVLTIALGFMYTRLNSGIFTGQAQTGNVAILATSSTFAAGPGLNKSMLFVENPSCTSRVISTGANPIMLWFAATSTANPGPNIGFIQAASTTVAYDSGIYGCTAVSAYGYAASTTITIAEFR